MLRYLLSMAAARVGEPLSRTLLAGYSVGTLVVNLIGCLLIGLLAAMAARYHWSDEVRLMLTVGLCGGLTTFSTFTAEGFAMLRDGYYATYMIYTLLSVGLGLGCLVIGTMVGRAG